MWRLLTTRSPFHALIGLFLFWIIGWFGSIYWAFDLFSHFQTYFVAAGIVLLVSSIWLHHKMGTFFALIFCLVSAGALIWFTPAYHTSKMCVGSMYKLISFNVHTSNTRKEDVVRFLQDQQTDVIALYEIDQAWVDALEFLKELYPYQLVRPSEDNFGIGIWSKKPLQNAKIEGTPMGIPFLRAHIGMEPGAPEIFAIHTLPPVSSYYSNDRNTLLQSVGTLLLENPDRTQILVGDFNATPWSWPLRTLIRDHALQSLRPYAWIGTWPSTIHAFGIPIDHILGRNVRCASGHIGPDLGSDHRPLITHFIVPQSEDVILPSK